MTRTLLLLLAVTALWCLAVFGSTLIDPDRTVRHFFKFVHIMALTLGFGAVLAVDTCGLAVLLRRRSPGFATRVAATVDPAIWIGYVAIVLSGLMLVPDLGSVPMWFKLVAALLAGLNGVLSRGAMRALLAVPRGTAYTDIPRALMLRVVAHASVSQAAWWAAAIIGYFWA
ncbi:hypothetical protein GXW82_35805 [Streptacidiphilus sp. 4-A2]|nr:hypothetical protein [Streptacidiphilus sp. 4-A2]